MALILNERVVREEILTFNSCRRIFAGGFAETKRGMEELTSDIPNVSEEATKDLDGKWYCTCGALASSQVIS